MPNTLTEKAIKQPFRVGLMLGALTLPTLWTMSQDVLNVVTHKPLLNSEEITLLFAMGFLPGMILGAGAVRAWTKWRSNEIGETRWLLVGHGIAVVIGCASLMIYFVLQEFPGFFDSSLIGSKYFWEDIAWIFYMNFPLQIALAMLLLGLFMRGKNA